MKTEEYFSYIVNEVHTTVAATVDQTGLPVTCAVDMMDWDVNGLYFLTAKGKNFYHRLKNRQQIALTGLKGENTLRCAAVSVQGKVRELGQERLPDLLEKNPYMKEIYPTEESREVLTVFQIYEGTGEWFDLSKKPIERESFVFGGASKKAEGYVITQTCIGCQLCATACPQNCIDMKPKKPVIRQESCLHCGYCFRVCPVGAVMKRGEDTL